MLASGKYGRLRIDVHSPSLVANPFNRHRQRHRCVEIEFVESRARDVIRQARDGCIAEISSYGALLDQGSFYARLHAAQMAGQGEPGTASEAAE